MIAQPRPEPFVASSYINEALGAALPAIVMDARRAARAMVMGEHGRRRAGLGEAFWQHREWVNGESVRQIDWRRSARSDKLFVRERERQLPALLQVWCDVRPNMDWRFDTKNPTKAERGLMMGLALAIAVRAGGERVCALGNGATLRNELLFAEILAQTGVSLPAQFQPGQVLIVSDGLEEPAVWAQRTKHIVSARAQLVVVLVADRAEQEFPFQGRVSFNIQDHNKPIVVGRAQSAQSSYVSAYNQHINEVTEAIKRSGGVVFSHVTDQSPLPVLLSIAAKLADAGPKIGLV